MSRRRYKSWAFLNDEGKKLYGAIFPIGSIPIVSIIPQIANLGGKDEKVYMVLHEEIPDVQIDQLLTLLASKFKASKEDVRAAMLKDRIPIREKYVWGVGTDGLPLFI